VFREAGPRHLFRFVPSHAGLMYEVIHLVTVGVIVSGRVSRWIYMLERD